MKIRIIAVGKVKEAYLREAVDEYLKRLTPFASVEVIEVKEGDIEQEGKDVLAKIKESFVVALDPEGKQYTSEGFAEFLKKQEYDVTFLIGGSIGLSKEVLEKADLTISFGQMTFTRAFARALLVEQLYRGFTILKNMPYNK